MAKMKGTFTYNVKGGNAAGFSNIPGASSATITMGKQFADKFGKAYGKAKKNQGVGAPAPGKTGSGNSSEDTVKGDNPKRPTRTAIGTPIYDGEVVDQGALPSGRKAIEDNIIDAEVIETPKAIGGTRRAIEAPPRLALEAPKTASAPASKAGGGKLGGFKVNPGTGQVKTTTRQISLADIQDPNSPTKRPIEPSNIPESYKPQGPAPSDRTWTAADKADLEAERPGSTTVAKQRRMEKDAPASASSPKPPKTTPASVKRSSGRSQQFSSTGDTSNQPPVNLDKL